LTAISHSPPCFRLAVLFFAEWINAFYEKSLVRFGGNAERMAPYVIAGTFIEKDKSISDRD